MKFDLAPLDFVTAAEDSVMLYGVRSLVEIKTGLSTKPSAATTELASSCAASDFTGYSQV